MVANGEYEVELGFAECWNGAFGVGKRVFDVYVGSGGVKDDVGVLNKVAGGLDVFKMAGGSGFKAVKIIAKVKVVDDVLRVRLVKKVQNAMISSIVVKGLDTPKEVSPVGPSEGNLPEKANVVWMLNTGFVGGDKGGFKMDGDSGLYDVKVPTGIYENKVKVDGGDIQDDVFTSHRWSPLLNYKLPVKSGSSYGVKLLFAEVWPGAWSVGARVFDVSVNGIVQVKGLDVFAKVGKNKAYVVDVNGVEPLKDGTISILLKSSVENAMLSGIIVETGGATSDGGGTDASTGEDPNDPTGNNGFDHRAHAVTGGPYSGTDFDGEGTALIEINGDGSHSHYFVPGPPVIVGIVTSYSWKNLKTGKVLSTAEKFSAPFPVGETPLELTITDTSGDTSVDTTTVKVVKDANKGAYCYYYNFNGQTPAGMPLTDSISVGPKPTFSAVTPSIDFPDLKSMPVFPFKNGNFGIRCVFTLFIQTTGSHTFYLSHAGPAKVILDTKTIITSFGQGEAASAAVALAAGDHSVQVLYYRSGPQALLQLKYQPQGKAKVTIPAALFSHATGKLVPVVTSITPESSPPNGGGQVVISGFGYFDTVKVMIGDKEATVEQFNSDTMLTIVVPPSTAGVKTLTVATPGGVSNGVPFTYSTTSAAPIKFKKTVVKTKAGATFSLQLVSSSAYGPDGRYYFGALNGVVHAVTINEDMIVQDACQSDSLGNNRAILGIGINPQDKQVKVYASTSTLYWGPGEKNILPINPGWYNGKIQTLVPKTGGTCLGIQQDIITGLPVSNHDHGVNGIQFDNAGNLYVNIGGFTNAGIPGAKLGNVDENPLSGATLQFKIGAPGFTGKITYSNAGTPQNAAVVGGKAFVSVYASGLRNPFGLVYHSNGLFYATDNGPNKSFGPESTGCNTQGGEVGFGDSLKKLSSAKAPGGGNLYFGHPNRNRGKTDARQCKYYASNLPSQSGFTKSQAILDSSSDGLVEYRSNSFGGQLKGDLFIGKFAVQTTGKLYRVQLSGAGDVTQIAEFTSLSALSMVEGERGELLMPKVYQNKIDVLVPDYDVPPALQMTKVSPNRGPKGGGNVVLITGFGFGTTPSATFGGKPCTNVKAAMGNSFKCTVPPGPSGGTVPVIVTTSTGGKTATSKLGDYGYMDV